MKAAQYALLGVIVCGAGTWADEGNIRLPKLPAKPYRYVNPNLPQRIHDQLKHTDRTPRSNPITDAGATLGRVLFFDKQLSLNNKIACASCHLQSKGFADPRRFSEGFDGGLTKRNAMSLANLRYTRLRGNEPGFFWDERAPTLEAQILMPIQDSVEMGMQLDALEERLTGLSYYPPLFKAAFGSPEITADRIAKSVAQFLRSMVSFDSKFDRAAAAMKSNDRTTDFPAFTPEENLGKSLFIEGVSQIAEIGCAHCHVPPTFSMPKSFNTGLDLKYADRGLGARDVPNNDPFTPNNDGKFRAPSLRNVALTAPYMHDGRFQTLEQVLDHYSEGVKPHENLALAFNDEATDKELSGFRLSDHQKRSLIAFLKTLTDEAFVKDPRFADPFPNRRRRP